MKGKDKLIKLLDQQIEDESIYATIVQHRIAELEKYGVSRKLATSYISLNENIASADDLLLYYFTMVYMPGKVTDFFRHEEIEKYQTISLPTEKIDSTITLRAIQIDDNQWIGRITTRELMHWRNAQIINYNENAQRTMKHIVSRGREYYQIALNQGAVDSISDSLHKDTYIPNTLTFNVPEDIVVNYDDDTARLSFNLDGQMLDILDGYHRYIALSKVSSSDPDYDKVFEIRIVQFSLQTAQQFIWQEDQKTKMTRIQSDSMNQYKLSNQITQKVNENPNCDFYKNITANGIINKGYFSAMVHQMYCKRVAQKNVLMVQKTATTELVDYLNWLATADSSYLDGKTWDKRIVYATVYLAAKGIKNIDVVHRFHDAIHSEKTAKYLFKRADVTATDIKTLDKLLKEALSKGGK